MSPVSQKVSVPAIEDMDKATFIKHFNARHDDSLGGAVALPPTLYDNMEYMYRSFHARLHATRVASDYDHEHLPEDPE